MKKIYDHVTMPVMATPFCQKRLDVVKCCTVEEEVADMQEARVSKLCKEVFFRKKSIKNSPLFASIDLIN